MHSSQGSGYRVRQLQGIDIAVHVMCAMAIWLRSLSGEAWSVFMSCLYLTDSAVLEVGLVSDHRAFATADLQQLPMALVAAHIVVRADASL